MPRFVILEHDFPMLHWDLMLEVGDVLQTWRLAGVPRSGQTTEAIALGDHRPMYLDYEGPVSGNRGTVKRWDAGVFEEAIDSTPTRRIFSFVGGRVIGVVTLIHVNEKIWRFAFESPGDLSH